MKKTSKIKTRILQFAEYKGFNKSRIYKDTGISNGTFDKPTGITEQVLDKFLNAYPEVDPVWLITGKGGSPVKISNPSLDDYSIVHERNVLYDLNLSQDEIDRRAEAVRDLRMQLAENAIPLVNKSAVAGFGTPNFFIEESDIMDYYVLPSLSKNVDFLIPVDGDSMSPKFESGDLVACNILHEDSFIQENKPHLIATDQGLLIKRLKPVTSTSYNLLSDNSNYPPITLDVTQIIGIALIVGYIRPE